jgi:hypothetical protein
VKIKLYELAVNESIDDIGSGIDGGIVEGAGAIDTELFVEG